MSSPFTLLPIQPTPLPPIDDPLCRHLHGPDIGTETLACAYERVFGLERRQTAVLLSCETTCAELAAVQNLSYLRLIGWFFVLEEEDQCRVSLTRWIESCEDDEAVVELGQFLLHVYLRLFRKYTGPATTSLKSHPSFDKRAQHIQDGIPVSPIDHSESMEMANLRDNFQCVVSKCISAKAYKAGSAAFQRELLQSADAFPITVDRDTIDVDSPRNVHKCLRRVVCMHILSESINQNGPACQKRWATDACGVLEAFGYDDIASQLAGPLVHRLENVFMLETTWQSEWDTSNVWLEHISDNRYKICCTRSREMLLTDTYSADGIIEFTSPNEDVYPLPSRRYIALHAAACKIAHLSGATRIFNDIDSELDEEEELAGDGTGGLLLDDRLYHVLRPAL